MAAFAVTLVLIPLVVAGAILLTLPSPNASTRGAADAIESPSVAAIAQTPSPPPATSSPPPAPTPSATPRPTPSPTPRRVEVGLGEPALIRVKGEAVGTVAAVGYKHSSNDGDVVLVVKVRYEMIESFEYDDDDWTARSDDGDVYELAPDQREPALDEGTIEAGEEEEGFLTFDVPRLGAADSVSYRPTGTSTIIEVDLSD